MKPGPTYPGATEAERKIIQQYLRARIWDLQNDLSRCAICGTYNKREGNTFCLPCAETRSRTSKRERARMKRVAAAR